MAALSPLMFVISLAHLYSWTGDTRSLQRHWDVARRILDEARTDGDKDRDGYLEYHTRSTIGTKIHGVVNHVERRDHVEATWKIAGGIADLVSHPVGHPCVSRVTRCALDARCERSYPT